MASTATTNDLKKGSRVIAAHGLAHVPEGTKGKVMLVNGLSWIRYWVRFENGVTMGSINRSNLATPSEWERKLSGAVDQPVDGAGTEEPETEASADGAGGGGVTTASGALVPQKLIDRSKAARERLGA
jgi:hypothetical protein